MYIYIYIMVLGFVAVIIIVFCCNTAFRCKLKTVNYFAVVRPSNEFFEVKDIRLVILHVNMSMENVILTCKI